MSAATQQNSELQQRRDELIRCKEVIGWSWLTLGQRLGLNSSQTFQMKSCRRAIEDSDLDWLRDLADAIEARPRPVVTIVPDRMVATVSMDKPASHALLDGVAADVVVRGEVVEVMDVIAALADAYEEVPSTLSTSGEQSGARWAVERLAERLGLLDHVAARIKARRAAPAPGHVVAPVNGPVAVPLSYGVPGYPTGYTATVPGLDQGMVRVPME